MTRIDFHFNVSDRVGYACRLLSKILNQGLTAVVTADVRTLSVLDERLWGFSETAFIGHAWLDQSPAEDILRNARVLLTENPYQCDKHELLISLSDLGTATMGFEQYKRLVEIVSHAEAERQNARQRWKYYAARGYEIRRHDVGARA